MRSLSSFTEGVEWRYAVAGLVLVAAVVAVTQLPDTGGFDGENQVEVLVSVDYGDRSAEERVIVEKGTTAFQALNQSFDVGYKDTSRGYFITSISGVSMNGSHSWIYMVNGEPPTVGANSYALSGDERLEFVFMSNNQSRKLFS